AYVPGAHRYFTIRDPKEREIAVAPFRDRVVHHAVVATIEPWFERAFISDSYACRKGKGVHAAIRRAQVFLRRHRWYVKTDVEKYFERVDHEALLGILRRKLKDRRILGLLETIIRNTREPGRGLPIGNLTSQFLANVYLDPLDHFIKERLRIRAYVRYMDDLVVFDDDPARLESLVREIEGFLHGELRLSLKPGSTWRNTRAHGLSFLGVRVFPGLLRVRGENRRRCLRRMRNVVGAWRTGDLSEEAMEQSLCSSAGHLRYFDRRAVVA
ncbi:group II intron reverse transcriptase domain-containing protein, partial [Candidatus Fermentibacteria bacterium]|nr:group II intron reverse transcriptase domain-containing protein [Candidatus Fermentibacteria bacterium]